MSEDSETITIKKCPLCGKSHSYELEIKRSWTTQLMTMDSMKTRYRKFVRVFVCPNHGEKYKATLSLPETGSDKIESVRVLGEEA